MIDFKQAVLRFKESHPKSKNKDIAKMLFPDKTEGRAESLMSRWMNGHELDTIRISQIRKICEVLNITPNDLIKWKK